MKTIGQGVKHSTKILIAFVVGQITQIIIHAVCLSFAMWDSRRIPFCLAAGFVIFFAVLMGVRISARETAIVHRTYRDYAEGNEE